MTQELVGYKILDSNNTILDTIGGTWGQTPGFPNPLILPNGDHVCGANGPGTFGNYTIIPWMMDTPLPTTDDVNRERDRRLVSGFVFNGKIFDSRPDDQTNIAGASQLAFMAVVAGIGTSNNYLWAGGNTAFGWIAHDNTVVPLDAPTMINFGKTAAAWKQAHMFAGRAIKDMIPIPVDYVDDKYWPTTPSKQLANT